MTVCSTPYGIRGKSTFNSPNRNAILNCAQRLTASEVKAQTEQTAVNSEVIGAQRLTASEVKARDDINLLLCSLNKCSTPYGIRGKSTL